LDHPRRSHALFRISIKLAARAVCFGTRRALKLFKAIPAAEENPIFGTALERPKRAT